MTWQDDANPHHGMIAIKDESSYSIVQYESLVKESFLNG